MSKIAYYELVKREYEPNPLSFTTAAVWSCVLCHEMIDGMGGPGNGEICCKCGDEIKSGKLKYDPTETKPETPATNVTGYVIKDPFTGLYSKGGTYGVFAPQPKIWTSVGAVKNHLALYISRRYAPNLKSAVVISKHYLGCVVLNLKDGSQPFKIHDYMKNKAEQEAKYYGYTVVDEWE